MKKFIAKCHKLGCKNRSTHNPELSEIRKTLKEALDIGNQMMRNNKTHVYINWEKGNVGYLIHYPNGNVKRYKI